MTYTTKGARPYPHEVPITVHFARDETLSKEEREHAIALLMAHSSGINFVVDRGDETAIYQEVPPTIRYRAKMWATLWRSAMFASHYFAIVKATDAEAEKAAQDLADELRDLILKQLPNSRESVAEIEARAE